MAQLIRAKPPQAFASAGPDPHTHAHIYTRARTGTHTYAHPGAQSLPRAFTPAHTQGYNKGRGASAALLFFRFSFLCSPPALGPARPALPAPRAPRRAGGRHSGAARRSGNFAARRAGDKSCGAAGGRAAKVCSLIVRKCVCARPGARRGGVGAAGGAGERQRRPHRPQPPPLASAGHPNRD